MCFEFSPNEQYLMVITRVWGMAIRQNRKERERENDKRWHQKLSIAASPLLYNRWTIENLKVKLVSLKRRSPVMVPANYLFQPPL